MNLYNENIYFYIYRNILAFKLNLEYEHIFYINIYDLNFILKYIILFYIIIYTKYIYIIL